MRQLLMLALLILVTVLISVAQDSPPKQTPLSAFTDVYSSNQADYNQFQLKFTFLGSQKKRVPSLGAVGAGMTFDGNAFIEFERDYRYSNDKLTLDTLILPVSEFKAFMDLILAHPGLQDTASVVEPNVSLMILRDLGPANICWEHLATVAETDSLYDFLRAAVSDAAVDEIIARYQEHMAGVRK